MVTLEIPQEYGYVLSAAVSSFLVSVWLGGRVGSYRKAAKIPYPYEYASYEQVQTASPKNKSTLLAFNAAQRAHQNFNEAHPSFLAALLITGLKFPLVASVLGVTWSVNRVVYAVGYTRTGESGGKGRYYGGLGLIAHYVLIGYSVAAAWKFVTAA